ncbi:MAG: hypothetical protein OEW90_00990 [Betaproteobacteria bacterium]|nr:hypothetical protein [Betaproteobacteria bacterium]MDH4322693.1 hypothetical protein [Betaproteobacteria bacterium]
MGFAPVASRTALTETAKKHLPDAHFVEVYEVCDGLPWKLVVRVGAAHPYVQHFQEGDLYLVCKMAATHFQIGAYP